MSFRNRINQLLEEELCSQALNVLVWGPGEGAGTHYEKRKKIQLEILNNFPLSDVRFSEDPELNEVIPGHEHLTTPELELYHLAACDLCVVLDASKGAGEEIAHFGRTKYAYKLFVLTDQRYKEISSFPGALRIHLNQVFYSDDEYESCNLVERVLNHLRIKALGKMAGLVV